MTLTLKQLREEVNDLYDLADALESAEIRDTDRNLRDFPWRHANHPYDTHNGQYISHPVRDHHILLNLSAIRIEMMALNKSLEVQNQLLLFSIENRIWFPRLRKLFLWVGNKFRRKS